MQKGDKMPNWIEGTFRARGSKENIKKFLLEALEPCVGYDQNKELLKEIIYEEDSYIEIEFKYSEEEYPKTLHIAGTHRQFVENICTIEANKTKNGEFQLALDYKGAWSIDQEHFIELAKKYEVDIKVNGYERGMEFESLFEVNRKGQVICDCYKEYSDYIWECPMPLLGG
jgi:hypothetical protein